MSLRYRPDREKWEASITVAGRRIRQLFELKKDAQEFLRDFRLKRVGISGIQRPYPLAEAFVNFVETESLGKTQRSKNEDSRNLQICLYFLQKERGLNLVEEVGLEDFQRLQIWASEARQAGPISKESWSDITIARCATILKAVFRKAFVTGRIQRNPAEHWKVPRGTPNRRRPMSAAEFDRLSQFVTDHEPWFLPVLRFLRLTGARGSSVARLVWSDIDFDRARVLLKSRKGARKSEKIVPIPMFPDLQNLLWRQWNERPGTSWQSVFVDRHGKPLTGAAISLWGYRLIRRAGLSGVVLYGLRHALAVDMTEAGFPLEVTRQALGHSNIQTTQIYAQGISSAAVDKAFRQIRAAQSPEETPPIATSIEKLDDGKS